MDKLKQRKQALEQELKGLMDRMMLLREWLSDICEALDEESDVLKRIQTNDSDAGETTV